MNAWVDVAVPVGAAVGAAMAAVIGREQVRDRIRRRNGGCPDREIGDAGRDEGRRQAVTTEAVARAAAYEAVAQVRPVIERINALTATVTRIDGMPQALERIEDKVDRVSGQVSEVSVRLGRVEGRFDQMDVEAGRGQARS